MTENELLDEVYKCLPPETRKRVKRNDIRIMYRHIFETITESIILEDPIKIHNFGVIRATFVPQGNPQWCGFAKKMVRRRPRVKIEIIPSKRLRKLVRNAEYRMRIIAERDQDG